MNPNDRTTTKGFCPLKLDSCPDYQQEENASADTASVKRNLAERSGFKLDMIDPSKHEIFDKTFDNKIAQLTRDDFDKISAIKNGPRKDQRMSCRGHRTHEIYIRSEWPEAKDNIYLDSGGQIIAPSNSFMSIKRKDAAMWSRAFDMEKNLCIARGIFVIRKTFKELRSENSPRFGTNSWLRG